MVGLKGQSKSVQKNVEKLLLLTLHGEHYSQVLVYPGICEGSESERIRIYFGRIRIRMFGDSIWILGYQMANLKT
jgi:hypothetical protein